MDLKEITEVVLYTEGSFVDRIEFWKGGKIEDFKDVGKAVSMDEYKKALEAWVKAQKG